MSTDTDDPAAARGRVTWRRTTVQFLYYLLLGMVAAVVGIVLEYGLPATFALAAAGVLLARVPVFALRGHATLRTDRPPAAVREELAAPNNPLTALWFDAADTVEEREDGRARLTAPGGLGVGEQRWDVAVTGDSPLTMTIARNGRPLIEAIVGVETVGDGTEVTLSMDRVRVRPLTVLTLFAGRSQYLSHFAAHGYEVVDQEQSIGLSIGRGPRPRAPTPAE